MSFFAPVPAPRKRPAPRPSCNLSPSQAPATLHMHALPVLPYSRAMVRPVIVVDTREQLVLPFSRLSTTTGTLLTGDYSFRGGEDLFAVERKTVDDLASCCAGENRQRFERELHRLRGFRFKRLLIVGTRADVEAHTYHSTIPPHAVVASVAAFEVRYDVPVVWTSGPEQAGAMVEEWVWWYSREIIQTAGNLLNGSENVLQSQQPNKEQTHASHYEH